ncbi:MAG: formate dehydrogenase accessory protein FdhE, partial [candidate division NC10 bacterium]|nr:formate dehydrogenase accessory protein FdhE [candidate division NC10 bacterium]
MVDRPHVTLSDRLREIHRVVHDARVDIESVRMDPATARLRLQAGQPLLAGASVPVDDKVAARLLREICRIVATPQAAWLLDADRQRPVAFQAMADALLAGKNETLAEARGVPQAFFAFVVLAALRPSFRRHMESLQSLTEDVPWHRPICPICGSIPSLAELRGEPGRRYLRCALCEGAWRVPRLRCPFCATTDHTRLRYLRIEEDPGMRLDLCDACRRYLKTRIAVMGALLTLYDRKSRLHRAVANEIRRKFPGYVFQAVIPKNVSLAEAPSFGKTILQYSPYSHGAKAYPQ